MQVTSSELKQFFSKIYFVKGYFNSMSKHENIIQTGITSKKILL